jgi:DNA replication factor GINS
MYDELHIAWKAEKSSQRLQPLPHDFYQRATKYFEELSRETSDTDQRVLHGRLTSREKEMAARLLGELRQARRTKIFQAAQSHSIINPADLTYEENILVEAIKEPDPIPYLNQGTLPTSGEPVDTKEKFVVIRFLQDIPEIVGIDLMIYGPFKKEDVASVPSTNATALIGQGAAKIIEFKKGQQPVSSTINSRQLAT